MIEFFGLDSSLMEWKFHEEKGFLCLYRPVKFCLENDKGKTRKAHSDDYDQGEMCKPSTQGTLTVALSFFRITVALSFANGVTKF